MRRQFWPELMMMDAFEQLPFPSREGHRFLVAKKHGDLTYIGLDGDFQGGKSNNLRTSFACEANPQGRSRLVRAQVGYVACEVGPGIFHHIALAGPTEAVCSGCFAQIVTAPIATKLLLQDLAALPSAKFTCLHKQRDMTSRWFVDSKGSAGAF